MRERGCVGSSYLYHLSLRSRADCSWAASIPLSLSRSYWLPNPRSLLHVQRKSVTSSCFCPFCRPPGQTAAQTLIRCDSSLIIKNHNCSVLQQVCMCMFFSFCGPERMEQIKWAVDCGAECDTLLKRKKGNKTLLALFEQKRCLFVESNWSEASRNKRKAALIIQFALFLHRFLSPCG